MVQHVVSTHKLLVIEIKTDPTGSVLMCATIKLMIIAALIILGLALGSFVNALVWRVHEQDHELAKKKPNKKYLQELSVAKGRSMCPQCKHGLAAKDLVPVLSWLSTRGRCRYCKKPISPQYPLVELATAILFVLSYAYWPVDLHGGLWLTFGAWLVVLTGLMALLVYDLRWYLLPNRILFPLVLPAAFMALVGVAQADVVAWALANVVLAVAVGGGIFYVLFQVSAGKWIGGGDVKLGWLLGLVVATPAKAFLFIFLAALLGSAVSLPLLATKRLKATSVIPFGPFLIVGAIIAVLAGQDVIDWYRHAVLGWLV